MSENSPALLMNYDIITTSGSIEFKGFKEMKESALKLAEHVKEVQVTEENVQESKRLLASINKEMGSINKRRIEAKKELLQPYETLDGQVKEIEAVINEASGIVKNQVNTLAQQERDEKEAKIKDIFEKRIKNYRFKDDFEFEDFLLPKHLNKSLSMNKVEEEMVEWLTGIDNDIMVIKGLSNADEVLTEYMETKDLSIAMNIVNRRNEQIKRSQEALERAKSNKEKQREAEQKEANQTALFSITGEKNIKMVELLLKDAGVEYERIEG